MENRVEELRKRLGMNQEDFAKALKVSRQTVSSIETGKYNPSLELAFVISDFFGKQIEEIFIPSKVSKICENAFYNCENLRKVLISPNSNLETIKSCTFSYTNIK